ncbi:MAG: monofunctional biosynthetic peptidoglycan transglycosylase [Candidatus Kapaibacteriales bacterium]
MKLIKKILRYLLYAIIAFHVWILALAFINPVITPYQILNLFEGHGIEKDWADYEEINPWLFRCLIAAEDARYFTHSGVDWKAVDEAKKANEKNPKKRRRGASTITMQTAKNIFLWHGRNYVRKGMEVYVSYIIDFVWGKKRVLEVYANVVEWGDGIYGVEAASQSFFNKSASELTKREASLLIAVLPNPKKWNPSKPTKYIQGRASTIRARADAVKLVFE